MTGTGGTSYIDFGTPNPAAMSDPNDIIYIDQQANAQHWTNTVSAYKWKSSDVEVPLSAKDALTDTGSSCIIGPKDSVKPIRDAIIAKIPNKTTHSSWGYLFSCSEALEANESFYLKFGGYWFEVRPEDYIVPVNNFGTCGLCITYQEPPNDL